MLEANVHQQVEYYGPMEASGMPIHEKIESTNALQPDFCLRTTQFPINTFNHARSENSMFYSGMGFFVLSVDALVNVSKRD